MKATLKRSERRSTLSNNVFKLSAASNASVSQPRTKRFTRALIGASLALGLLAGCTTTPKQPENTDVRYFTGKAQVFDKNKKKVEWVYFNSTVRAPDKLRLDVSMGLLGIPLGTLVINGNQATLVSLFERKAYVTENGDQVLEKLMKTQISPKEITALFAENLPLGGGWKCGGEPTKQRCTQNDVQVDWEKLAKNDRKMMIEGPKSKVIFMYQPSHSGKDQFEVAIPNGFEVIRL